MKLIKLAPFILCLLHFFFLSTEFNLPLLPPSIAAFPLITIYPSQCVHLFPNSSHFLPYLFFLIYTFSVYNIFIPSFLFLRFLSSRSLFSSIPALSILILAALVQLGPLHTARFHVGNIMVFLIQVFRECLPNFSDLRPLLELLKCLERNYVN